MVKDSRANFSIIRSNFSCARNHRTTHTKVYHRIDRFRLAIMYRLSSINWFSISNRRRIIVNYRYFRRVHKDFKRLIRIEYGILEAGKRKINMDENEFQREFHRSSSNDRIRTKVIGFECRRWAIDQKRKRDAKARKRFIGAVDSLPDNDVCWRECK